MANNLDYNDALKNAMLDTIDGQVGAAGKLQIFAHTATPTIDAADAGTKVADITMGATMMAAAAAGAISKAGDTWSDTSADATGTANYFRVKTSAAGTGASTTIMQGTVGLSAGTFDLELDNTSITAGQTVTVSAFTITGGN